MSLSPPRARVLFVDDHRPTREAYAEYLEGVGYEVMTSESGSAVFDLVVDWRPAVIVLDLGLKDVDGWEVARRLKADVRTASVPIIAFTGAALQHERASAMRAGCDRVVNKPCPPASLVDEIERCVHPHT
jgi:CheY-like chemotaxis protein